VALGQRRPQGVHARRLAEPPKSDCGGLLAVLGRELLEEAFHPGRSGDEDREHAARRRAGVLPGVGKAAGDVDERSLRGGLNILAEQYAEGTLDDIEHLVLLAMRVHRWPLALRDDRLERGHGVARLGRRCLEDDRSADRVLDHPALGRAAVESTIDLWAGHRAILSRRPDGRRGTCKSRRTSDRS